MTPVPRIVAWLPMPPLLAEEVGGFGDEPLRRLRADVAAAVAEVATAAPDAMAALAPTGVPVDVAGQAGWSWHGFGVGPAPSGPVLPWPLGLAAAALDRAGYAGRCRYLGVTGPAGPLPVGEPAPGLLVFGDGSVGHGEPGVDEAAARGWDDRLAERLAGGDLAGLAGADVAAGLQYRSAAAVSYPAAARWLTQCGVGPPRRAELRHRDAPYGIAYLVALWRW